MSRSVLITKNGLKNVSTKSGEVHHILIKFRFISPSNKDIRKVKNFLLNGKSKA
jgi:hypothetical protein